MYERPYATEGEVSCTDEEKSYYNEKWLWSLRGQRLLRGQQKIVSLPTPAADGKSLHIAFYFYIDHYI
jgi:hypothetical protein